MIIVGFWAVIAKHFWRQLSWLRRFYFRLLDFRIHCGIYIYICDPELVYIDHDHLSSTLQQPVTHYYQEKSREENTEVCHWQTLEPPSLSRQTHCSNKLERMMTMPTMPAETSLEESSIPWPSVACWLVDFYTDSLTAEQLEEIERHSISCIAIKLCCACCTPFHRNAVFFFQSCDSCPHCSIFFSGRCASGILALAVFSHTYNSIFEAQPPFGDESPKHWCLCFASVLLVSWRLYVLRFSLLSWPHTSIYRSWIVTRLPVCYRSFVCANAAKSH